MNYLKLNPNYNLKLRGTIDRRGIKSKCFVLTLLIIVFNLCNISVTNAIMTFPEHGVYSLFPHEDLRTGKRLRFEESDPIEKYREPNRGRDDLSFHHEPPPNIDRPILDRPPSREPYIVDILRPSTTRDPSNVRKLTNSFESFHRERDRDGPQRLPNLYRHDDRYNKNNRNPRVYFDDERRLFGYGKKYQYHDELPPTSNSNEDPSRETNLIRPSPVDFTDSPNYRYLPEAKLPPRARDRDDGDRPTRIHLFTPNNADKFSSSRNNQQNLGQRDGPVLVDSPGPNAFLNHEEYLNFHTKIALDTLELEKKKLEDTRRKILFSARPQTTTTNTNNIAGQLIPPNFSKEVTVIEESVESSSDERRPGSSSAESGEEEEDENNIGTTTTHNPSHEGDHKILNSHYSTPPSTFSTKLLTGGENEGDKTKNKQEILATPHFESGFLPVIPFQLRGQNHSEPTIIPILPETSTNSQNSSTSPLPPRHNLGEEIKSTKFNLPSPSSLFSVTEDFNLNRKLAGGPIGQNIGSSLEMSDDHGKTKRRPSGTNPTASTITSSNVYDKTKTMTRDKVPSSPFPVTTSTSTVTAAPFPLKNGEGNRKRIASISSIPLSHSKGQKPSPFVFVDSSEVPSSFNLSMPHEPPPHDKMMIYVQRVKPSPSSSTSSSTSSTTKRRQQTVAGSSGNSGVFSSSGGDKIEEIVSVHKTESGFAFEEDESSSKPLLQFYPVKYNDSDLSMTEDQVIATTGNGINSGVVAKVHSHISTCPKLYGEVEVICDIHVRERHGHPNPQLIVGWLRKFYNETVEDKILAVNKTLAYEEDFHDKFNVTLAPGISPMLRSVLIIKQVTAPDCGNYQCQVFDGVSTHKSETLLFLCH